MWFKIKSYITFLSRSTNQHGVHSPFVYDFLTKCLYLKINTTKLSLFKKIKKSIISNKNIIDVTDFGKGSKVFKTNQREVSKIAKIAGISNKKATLLIKIISYFNFENILEIGTSVGLGTSAIQIGNLNTKITTLEGCENTAQIAKETFIKFGFDSIKIRTGNFKNTLPSTLKNNNFDFIYFDGNHQKEPTLNYFNHCIKSTHDNSVFIFDDINWSLEMQNTWKIIKANPNVTVTIDTYFWGIVFFRKEQKKQHFTIRV